MIVKTEDRTFTINGLRIHEVEWFSEDRPDIFQIWFGVDHHNEPRYVPRVGDRIFVEFAGDGLMGNVWSSPILVEVDYEDGETIGNTVFRMIGPPRKL